MRPLACRCYKPQARVGFAKPGHGFPPEVTVEDDRMVFLITSFDDDRDMFGVIPVRYDSFVSRSVDLVGSVVRHVVYADLGSAWAPHSGLSHPECHSVVRQIKGRGVRPVLSDHKPEIPEPLPFSAHQESSQ